MEKKGKGALLPKKRPILIKIPAFNFVTIEGEGSPENESYSKRIGVLYSISSAIKMNLKKMSKLLKG